MSSFPEADPISATHWGGIRDGCLMIQYCRDCERRIWYPRAFCPSCMSNDLGWLEAGGQGRIHAFTIVYRHWDQSFATPFVVALVELEEGVVLTATIDVEPSPDAVFIDMPVELVEPGTGDDASLPRFRPCADAAPDARIEP